MVKSTRRTLWYVVLALFVLAVFGSLRFWGVHPFLLSRNQLDKATWLASIALPAEASLLAWSADGSYIAAGTGYTSSNHVVGPAKVFVVDVGKEAVVATLDTTGSVTGLAFSPDGKWLAVAEAQMAVHGELIVFAVPEFTAKFKAKALPRKNPFDPDKEGSPGFFVDIAWVADSKSLHAIDGGFTLETKLRRWTAPEFVEQPTISWEYSGYQLAVAVAPDGRTAATVAQRPIKPGVLQLFDLEKGTKLATIEGVPYGRYRAAFTTDGKTVGVFVGIANIFDLGGKQPGKQAGMFWWDVATGKAANPTRARFAVQPAAQAESRFFSIAPDSRIWAWAWYGENFFARQDDPERSGGFVHFTQTDAAKTWTWRVGTENSLSLAFSPDGTKLAGTLKVSTGWTITLWAVP